MMCCCSVGRSTRQESTVRSRRNPISKPMRRQSGKMSTSDSKVTLSQLTANSDIARPVSADNKSERTEIKKVDSGLSDTDTGAADINDLFHPPLAERVKLRRMSQSTDVHSSSSGGSADKSERPKSKLLRSAAKKSPAAGKRISLKHVAKTGKKSSGNNQTKSVCSKKQLSTVKLALMKKNSAIRTVVSSSKTTPNGSSKSIKPDAKRSVQNKPAPRTLTANKLKQSKKEVAGQKLKSKTTVSKSDSVVALKSEQKYVTLDTRPPTRSCNLAKEPKNTSFDVAVKMPQLKANSKQNAVSRRLKSMPVLEQEMSLADTNQSVKKSPKKRQQPTPTEVKSKSPKLSPVNESSHVAEKRSLRNNDVRAEMSFSDDDMPQLLAVELTEKMKPLTVVVDQFDGPPELDRSPLCDAEEHNSAELKSGCQSPARCLRDNRATAVKTSPRSVRTAAEHPGDTSENATPKQSPARSKHHASPTPVSNSTALSQSNGRISSPVTVTQTVCSISSPHSNVTQSECNLSDSEQQVAVTSTNCSTSPQTSSSPLKQTSPVAKAQPKDEPPCRTDCTEPSSEIVPYTCPPSSVTRQWQVPCGVPMAPFIVTGMYPMMGSGYGCQMTSLPPFVIPAMPAATAVISARGGSHPSTPLQYSSYHLLRSAAPVVPLYMSPVVGPLMQPDSASSPVNIMPFVSSLPHAAVHNQQSAATLVLRPSMLPADHMYCMLPGQQQVNPLLSGR